MKYETISGGTELSRRKRVFYDMERRSVETFPCPRCGDRIPADAGRVGESEGGETVRRALCPSCKGPLVRAADGGDSPWQLED